MSQAYDNDILGLVVEKEISLILHLIVEILQTELRIHRQFKVFLNSDIEQMLKCFVLESSSLSCQTEHGKIIGQLNFNPGLALISILTTGPYTIPEHPIPVVTPLRLNQNILLLA